jgi:2-amino-4-hydroxy-6-hydroxymethyldihydropteridine diphosphokinase
MLRAMHKAYLGLGSNVGDRAANLAAALEALAPEARVLRTSHIYETEPWGYTDQARFLNQAAEVETALTPAELLHHVKHVEGLVGRQATFRYGPREIDIDILLYDDLHITLGEAEGNLQIPHPRLAERAFALQPLADLARETCVPGHNRSVIELLSRIPHDGVHRWEPA